MEKAIKEILIIFLLVQLIGLACGVYLIFLSPEENLAAYEPSESVSYSLFFIASVLFGALFMYLLLRVYKGNFLFKIMESCVIFISSWVVFSVVVDFLMLPWWLSLLFAFALVVLKAKFSKARNVAALISSAGVGALFGYSLGFLPVALFAIFLSFYDFIAVFLTKHMVMFAQRFSKMELSFSIAAEIEKKPEEPGKPEGEKKEEEHRKIELGTGDLTVPLMITVSSFKLGCIEFLQNSCIQFSPSLGVLFALISIVFSTVALYSILDFVYKKRGFLPALPPLVLSQLISISIFYIFARIFLM